jgi:hypothetical protein
MIVGWGLKNREEFYLRDLDQISANCQDSRVQAQAPSLGDGTPPACPLQAGFETDKGPKPPISAGPPSLEHPSPLPRPFSFSSDSMPLSTPPRASSHKQTNASTIDPAPGEAPLPELDSNLPLHHSSSTSSESSNTTTANAELTISSSDATMGSLKCSQCGKVLSGKAVWLSSNMQRHIREKHSAPRPRLACPVPGCGKTFGRNHNLLHHMRTVHGK